MKYSRVTLFESIYFIFIKLPLLSWASSITEPTYSFGTIISVLAIGSSIYFISAGGGNSDGLYNSNTSPFVLYTLYITDGAVVIIFNPYSLSNLSSIISICKSPRKPHLNPWPKAFEDSNS